MILCKMLTSQEASDFLHKLKASNINGLRKSMPSGLKTYQLQMVIIEEKDIDIASIVLKLFLKYREEKLNNDKMKCEFCGSQPANTFIKQKKTFTKKFLQLVHKSLYVKTATTNGTSNSPLLIHADLTNGKFS